MKRLFTLILTFIICATFFIIPTSAETYDTYDSRYLTEEEKAQLSISYADDIIPFSDITIIKLYCGMFSHRFAKQEDIISIIETTSNLEYMFAINSVHMQIKVIHDGEGVIIGNAREWGGFYTYTKYPNLVFDPSVKVNKIYCFNALMNYDGAYIYYDTDHGTYILFKEYENSKETYLFPLSNFYEFAKAKKGIDGANIESFEMENYLLSDTPHAVPHQDTNNDEKCDACGGTIPENNDPFPHISNINTDKTEETDPPADNDSNGCDSSVALSVAVPVIFMGMSLVIKKKRTN